MKRLAVLSAVLLGVLFLGGAASLFGVLAQDRLDVYDLITRDIMRPYGLARSDGLRQGDATSQATGATIDVIARDESEQAADEMGLWDILVVPLR